MRSAGAGRSGMTFEDSRGKTIRSIEDVERGEYIKIIVSDGSISAAVADKEKM